jgi:hypothetical protein
VRHAQVIVNLENRRAVEVLRVGFFRYRASDASRLERVCADVETMRTAAL